MSISGHIPSVHPYRILLLTWHFLRQNKKQLAQILLMPFAIQLSATVISTLVLDFWFNASLYFVLQLLLLFLNIFLIAVVAVGCIRLVLFWDGEQHLDTTSYSFLRLFRVCYDCIVLFSPIWIISLLLLNENLYEGVPILYILGGLVVTIVVTFLIYSRFFLRLVATCVDAPYDWKDARTMTRGKSAIAILKTMVITVMPVFVFVLCCSFLIYLYFPMVVYTTGTLPVYDILWSYWFLMPFLTAIELLPLAVLFTVSAITFYFRTGWRPGAVRSE